MTVERYDREKHLDTLMEWWKHYGIADRIKADTLPPHGAVAGDDNGPGMAGFVYLAIGCKVCFFERLLARPGNTPKQSRQMGHAIYTLLKNQASLMGYKEGFAHVEDRRMVREAQAVGFQIAVPEATILHKQL